jgi:AcrR family transcriptional regulator
MMIWVDLSRDSACWIRASVRLGRPPAMTPEKLAYARQLLAEPDRSLSAIAKLVGVSRTTLYKVLPELLPPKLAQQRLRRAAGRPARGCAAGAVDRAVRPAADPANRGPGNDRGRGTAVTGYTNPRAEDISNLNAALEYVLECSTVGTPTRQRIARTLTTKGLADAKIKALLLRSVPLRCHEEVKAALDDEGRHLYTLVLVRTGELLGRPAGA